MKSPPELVRAERFCQKYANKSIHFSHFAEIFHAGQLTFLEEIGVKTSAVGRNQGSTFHVPNRNGILRFTNAVAGLILLIYVCAARHEERNGPHFLFLFHEL